MAGSHRNRSDASNASQLGSVSAEYRALLDALPLGTFTVDPHNRVISINPIARRLLGWEEQDALGRVCPEVFDCALCGPGCAAHGARKTEVVRRSFPTVLSGEDGTARSVLVDAVPIGDGRVVILLRDVTEAEKVRQALQDRWVFHGLVCASPASKGIVRQIRDVAPCDSTVLITGESGTGKELVARAIHAESPRVAKPFVVVNCAAYSEILLESELFGHARGSFAGAERDRAGRFELAEGGTVLLDEIAAVPPRTQAKLLRALQQREIERLGESRTRHIDIRVQATTDKDLRQEERAGRFREDLYYRLNAFRIELPPLRERVEDIPALADVILERIAGRTNKRVRGLTEEVMGALLAYAWPGNVRELEKVLEDAIARARDRDVVRAIDLRDDGPAAIPDASAEDRIRDALQRTSGCVTRAARLLEMHRTTLWRHMREKGIRREDFLVG